MIYCVVSSSGSQAHHESVLGELEKMSFLVLTRKKMVLLVFFILRTVESGFIPGRGCGTLTAITVLDDISELEEDASCVLITDQKSYAKLKTQEPSV